MEDATDRPSWFTDDLSGPAREFALYSLAERERREDSDPDFDPRLFDDAVELVLDRLRGIAREVVR